MDKREKLEKAKDFLQSEIEKLDLEKVENKESDNETEILLDSDSEAVTGGDAINDRDKNGTCSFFCLTQTF